MSFVWEMKQEKKRNEKELFDYKYYYTRTSQTKERNNLNERKVLRVE